MVSIAENHRHMVEYAAHSTMLWRCVNGHIARILKQHISRADMVRRLLNAAGPKKKGEPVCVGNYRTAARQLANGERISVL